MNDLVGNYKLASHGIIQGNNEFIPTSSSVKGELIYSDEGYHSVLIFFNSNQEESSKVLAHFGKYEINGDDLIVHKIKECNQAYRDNSVEIRNYRIEGNFLILSRELGDGRVLEERWERERISEL